MSLFDQLIPFQSYRPARQNGATEEEPYRTPVYEVKEDADAYGLEVQLPGIARDGVEIQVSNDQLVLDARPRWEAPKDWTPVFRESTNVRYHLRLDLNEAVDVDKINAEIEHGVLRITLPKAEAVKPRKIDVS